MAKQSQASIQIRKANPDEAPSIASVLYRSFLEYKPYYTPEAFAVTTPTSDRVLERLREGPVWVALQHDHIVGTASAVAKGEGLYLRGMAVLPEARGQRIGWRLLEHIERFAAKKGFKRLFLSTTPFLKAAIRLYEHFGFRRVSEGPYDLFGTPLFTMAKTLKKEGIMKKVAILAFPEVEELDLVGVYEVLAKTKSMREESALEVKEPLHVEILGLYEREITCRNGLIIKPHRVYQGLKGYDILIVPGGKGVSALRKDKALLSEIAAFARDHLVCSVCTGAFVLAEAGLLEGKKATTHHEARDKLKEYCQVSKERVVIDGNIITAGGVSCSLDLGLKLLEIIYDKEVRDKVARRLELELLTGH